MRLVCLSPTPGGGGEDLHPAWRGSGVRRPFLKPPRSARPLDGIGNRTRGPGVGEWLWVRNSGCCQAGISSSPPLIDARNSGCTLWQNRIPTPPTHPPSQQFHSSAPWPPGHPAVPTRPNNKLGEPTWHCLFLGAGLARVGCGGVRGDTHMRPEMTGRERRGAPPKLGCSPKGDLALRALARALTCSVHGQGWMAG